MIPVKDTAKLHSFPFVNILFILINLAIFIYEICLGKKVVSLFYTYGIVPSNFFKPVPFLDMWHLILPYITSQFLHAGWLHLIGNMLFLWVFGDNIEDRLGHWRYFWFYLLCGVISGLVHTFIYPDSNTPAIGASGAISGVLGAYLILFPRAKISCVIPLIILYPVIEIPAVIFLLFWFLIQYLSGISAFLPSDSLNIAWWVHIGGFIGGIVLILTLFRTSKRKK